MGLKREAELKPKRYLAARDCSVSRSVRSTCANASAEYRCAFYLKHQPIRLHFCDTGSLPAFPARRSDLLSHAPANGQTMRSLAYHVTLLLLACTSEATFAADVDHGSILAQRWCASCHVVSSAQRVEIDHIPSFASIAQRADFSAEKLAFFLLEPHPKMPNMSLSRKEADDLAEQRR
jgi:mono/diheme cytochrome c family protein